MTPPSDVRPRLPLDPDRLAAALATQGAAWGPVDVVASTGSTNADLLAAAAQGAPHGCVLVAEEQVTGRGRLDRGWAAPPSSGLLVSVLLRPPPSVPAAAWGWLPLLVGVAVAGSLRETTGVDVRLKWPNDIVVDAPAWGGGPGPRKLGGILVERVPGEAVAVVGIGLNVDLGLDERPAPAATSLLLEAADHPPGRLEAPSREEILAGFLAAVQRRYETWVGAGGDAERSGIAAAYRALCVTLGRPVQVQRPAAPPVTGTATDLAADGALVLVTDTGPLTVRAGDVVHLR